MLLLLLIIKYPLLFLLACSIAEHDMARFQPMELMSEVHGKLHGKSKYYAAEKYGTQYTGLIGEISVPPTENQLTAREKFKQARQNVCALSEEEIAAYQEAFPGGRHGNPLQYSCLENPMDRGAWWVCGVTKSWRRLK